MIFLPPPPTPPVLVLPCLFGTEQYSSLPHTQPLWLLPCRKGMRCIADLPVKGLSGTTLLMQGLCVPGPLHITWSQRPNLI